MSSQHKINFAAILNTTLNNKNECLNSPVTFLNRKKKTSEGEKLGGRGDL